MGNKRFTTARQSSSPHWASSLTGLAHFFQGLLFAVIFVVAVLGFFALMGAK